MWLSEGLSKHTLNAVVHCARHGPVAQRYRTLSRHFHATRNAVLLTAPGRGTPGVRAKVVAYRNKPERCVLYKTINVEARLVRVEGVKREAVIQECKFCSFLSISEKFN